VPRNSCSPRNEGNPAPMARKRRRGRLSPRAPRVLYLLYACMFFTIGIVDFSPAHLLSPNRWSIDLGVSLIMFFLCGVALVAATTNGPHVKN